MNISCSGCGVCLDEGVGGQEEGLSNAHNDAVYLTGSDAL